MKIDKLIAPYRIERGKGFRLKDIAPDDTRGLDIDKDEARAMLAEGTTRLTKLQEMLYAQDRWAVLLIFQAMDAAGKDGVIKHVMSGINPQGCQVFSFKAPTTEELDHDFMWRTTCRLPERGRIGIFNRSYYEEVLVVRVHPELLAAERLPEPQASDKHVWRDRYRSIVGMEQHLHRNGTRIVKFFLHMSKAEQRRRLLARIDDPDKHWKFSLADVQERKFWNQYMEAYAQCLSATSTDEAPWYVVPADDKQNARLLISGVILETLRSLELTWPKLDKTRVKELRKMRKLLD
jgi:PPK2 family polyphosphate:nucleotide phosphotransferase